MAVRVVWDDPGVVRLVATDEEPDSAEVFATFTEARRVALDSARDNRDTWAACVRDLRAMTKDDVQG